jgi:hypothetical protein
MSFEEETGSRNRSREGRLLVADVSPPIGPGSGSNFGRRSVLYSLRNASKARCCSLRLERGGLAVSAFSVRCIRSCLPFCCGRPGWIRSGRMPSLIHQMAKWESPADAQEAKGGPLSVRMASGSPYSRKADSKMGCTTRAVVRRRPSHRRRNRLKPSEMVSVCT